MRGTYFTGLLGMALAVGIGWSFVWHRSAEGRADAAGEKPARTAGWRVTFTSLARGGATDSRAARLAALYVPAGGSPSPFLPPGPFRAVWQGVVSIELKTEHTFSAAGRGNVRVEVDGVEALSGSGDFTSLKGKPVALRRGDHVVTVRYESPAKGNAEFRLNWASEEFRHEPLGLTAVQHDPSAKDLAQGRTLRLGRETLTTHRCLACHTADTAAWLAAGGMPEVGMDAPSLADVGARLQPGWVARWLQDPQALRPGATMPRLFSDLPRGDRAKLDPRVRDMAAYLATLGKPADEREPAATKETVETGIRLFATLGCIGCHMPPERDELVDADHGRLPLRDVSAKWRPDALRAFLRQPDRHFAWIRMPNFNLSATEAAALAAYLRSVKPRAVFPARLDGANTATGRTLVGTLGCTACHALESKAKVAPPTGVPPLAKLTGDRLTHGCLAAKPGKAPAFALTKPQQEALVHLLTHAPTAAAQDTSAEFAERQRVSLRCHACHKQDGRDDLWSQLKEENEGLTADLPPLPPDRAGKFPAEQVRPPLTWIGQKLKPEWTAKLLAGTLPYKPRPYLRARMPAFPRRSMLLAGGLAAQHGYAPTSPPDPPVEARRADIGRTLAGKTKWNCVGCHMVGTSAAVGVFEAPGVNFAYAKERLRRDYFDRWMWAPTRVEPGTKMPVVYTWGKPSLLTDPFDSDAGKQIDALWQYLQRGRDIKPPE